MKAPDIKITSDKESIDENFAKEKAPQNTLADFPINDKLLLDEVAKAPEKGYIHIQIEADESIQHPESRSDVTKTEETLLDEVAKKPLIDYPDIE